jgi:hypothetical protein
MTERPAPRSFFRRWVGAHFGHESIEAAGHAFSRSAAQALRRAGSYVGRGKRHHCIISGTGRAGTSYLVQLLTRLELDTGYTPDHLPLYPAARAGLELDIWQENAPYIIKTPWLCDYIEDVLERRDIVIDHAIIPMRSIGAAAQSRIHVERLSKSEYSAGAVPGGLWGTASEGEQERILLDKFYALLWPLVRHAVPITFLAYPRLVLDPRYLYDSLGFLLPKVSFHDFQDAWREVVRPEWMHQFGSDDTSAQSGPVPLKALQRQAQ